MFGEKLSQNPNIFKFELWLFINFSHPIRVCFRNPVISVDTIFQQALLKDNATLYEKRYLIFFITSPHKIIHEFNNPESTKKTNQLSYKQKAKTIECDPKIATESKIVRDY
ncbi:hypothetical protein WH96_13170 [Kiloniella spongiae]|uniref:Uncharacterized protein n=1 Tax=Kiloniella spongiae TaxID=1489064 RepID=A0A0H2MHA8_9PROT|nr:hypothetical protein WH96_13170 [Kiloniella spongiae]